MKRTLTALTVAATMFASSASAFDPNDLFNPDDVQKLKDTNECRGCNLRGANLAYDDLKEADLTDANLSGAYLLNTILFAADLSGADLGGANLLGADLTYAYMNGAILCNTTMPSEIVIYSGC